MCLRNLTYWQPRHPGRGLCGGGYIDVKEESYLLAASAPRHRGLVWLCEAESQLP
jgi:hypothetical protein